MTEEQRTYENVSDQFDFSPDDLKEEGYKFWARVQDADIRLVKAHSRTTKEGVTFPREDINEVNIWAVPLKGRDGEEPKARPIIQAPFTNNVNSKVGFFRSESAKAGVIVKNITELKGRVFQFEVIEHKKFGGTEASKFCVIRAEDKGAAGVVSAATTSAPASIDWDTFGAQVVELMDGHEASAASIMGAVTSSPLKSEVSILTAAASGALLREAQARGLIEVVSGKIQRAA